jgi:glycosyltransferase involved in cell wall biosynthesis
LNEQVDISLRFDDMSARRGPIEEAAVRRRKVLVIGLFPPPINGQRIVTQRMFEQISSATTAMRYDLNGFPRLGWLSKPLSATVAAGLMAVARFKGFTAIYLAPHSGSGLLLSCFLALTSRCLGYELYVHYHSYRHVAHHSRLMSAFLGLCGRETVHIVLAPPMEWGLKHFYHSVRRVAIVSNSVFVTPRPVPRAFDHRRLRIGHLSNLSREKGIEIVLECLRQLLARGTEVELLLGGPATDRATRAVISRAATEFGQRLCYLGPLDHGDIYRFYEEIDIFLFPTLYEHEAEPLVIIDAVSAGVPVLATNRGCIGYLLRLTDGYAFDAFDFVDRAVDRIAIWAESPAVLREASARAQARFRDLHLASQEHLSELLAGLLQRG